VGTVKEQLDVLLFSPTNELLPALHILEIKVKPFIPDVQFDKIESLPTLLNEPATHAVLTYSPTLGSEQTFKDKSFSVVHTLET
jgi:hypothetical protein